MGHLFSQYRNTGIFELLMDNTLPINSADINILIFLAKE